MLNDFFRPSGAWLDLVAFFPSDESLGYCRSSLRDFPQVKFPVVLVVYRFTGFFDEIYATLVVRLHHSEAFQQDELWRHAADFNPQMKSVGFLCSMTSGSLVPAASSIDLAFSCGVSGPCNLYGGDSFHCIRPRVRASLGVPPLD